MGRTFELAAAAEPPQRLKSALPGKRHEASYHGNGHPDKKILPEMRFARKKENRPP